MSLEIHRTRVDNALSSLNWSWIWSYSEPQLDWMPKYLILLINYFYNRSNLKTKAITAKKKKKTKINLNITKKVCYLNKMCNIFPLIAPWCMFFWVASWEQMWMKLYAMLMLFSILLALKCDRTCERDLHPLWWAVLLRLATTKEICLWV